MELIEAIKGRRSIRAFKPDPVPRETIVRLLEIARWAPSGANSQPWRVTIVQGERLEAWRQALLARLAENPWDEARRRAFEVRVRTGSLAELVGLAGQSAYEVLVEGSNRFYGAPAVMVLSFRGEEGARIPEAIPAFVTTFMLAAHEMGLGTCWLGFAMGQADLLREYAKIPADEQPAAVVALGYPDLSAPINRFRSPREPVEAFTRWVE